MKTELKSLKEQQVPCELVRNPVEDDSAAPDRAVPVLSQAARESEAFMTREPPPAPPAGVQVEERDLRGARHSRFATYERVEDPFAHAKFDVFNPVDKRSF